MLSRLCLATFWRGLLTVPQQRSPTMAIKQYVEAAVGTAVFIAEIGRTLADSLTSLIALASFIDFLYHSIETSNHCV
jgi:hypothetical protein